MPFLRSPRSVCNHTLLLMGTRNSVAYSGTLPMEFGKNTPPEDWTLRSVHEPYREFKDGADFVAMFGVDWSLIQVEGCLQEMRELSICGV